MASDLQDLTTEKAGVNKSQGVTIKYTNGEACKDGGKTASLLHIICGTQDTITNQVLSNDGCTIELTISSQAGCGQEVEYQHHFVTFEHFMFYLFVTGISLAVAKTPSQKQQTEHLLEWPFVCCFTVLGGVAGGGETKQQKQANRKSSSQSFQKCGISLWCGPLGHWLGNQSVVSTQRGSYLTSHLLSRSQAAKRVPAGLGQVVAMSGLGLSC